MKSGVVLDVAPKSADVYFMGVLTIFNTERAKATGGEAIALRCVVLDKERQVKSS